MKNLSARALAILEQMRPDVGYEASELRQFVPELSAEALREVMHGLWVERQVERFGYSGWRRVRSTRVANEPTGRTRQIEVVKPEDLFDHDGFAGLFK